MEETVGPGVGNQPPLEGDEEAPASILSGLAILNVCNEFEQRIQINAIGDE